MEADRQVSRMDHSIRCGLAGDSIWLLAGPDIPALRASLDVGGDRRRDGPVDRLVLADQDA